MVWHWLWDNWISVIETLSVIFAGIEIRESTKARRLSDLFVLTQSHRELWTLPIRIPALKRVLLPYRDLYREPLTFEEKEFLNLLFLHLKSAFEARKSGLPLDEHSLRSDIREFFGLPAPAKHWESAKKFFDPDFRNYVRDSVNSADATLVSC